VSTGRSPDRSAAARRFLGTLLDTGAAAAFSRELHQVFLAAQEGLLRPGLNSPEAIEMVLAHIREHPGTGGSLIVIWAPHIVS
jgi:hypothetical protein